MDLQDLCLKTSHPENSYVAKHIFSSPEIYAQINFKSNSVLLQRYRINSCRTWILVLENMSE